MPDDPPLRHAAFMPATAHCASPPCFQVQREGGPGADRPVHADPRIRTLGALRRQRRTVRSDVAGQESIGGHDGRTPRPLQRQHRLPRAVLLHRVFILHHCNSYGLVFIGACWLGSSNSSHQFQYLSVHLLMSLARFIVRCLCCAVSYVDFWLFQRLLILLYSERSSDPLIIIITVESQRDIQYSTVIIAGRAGGRSEGNGDEWANLSSSYNHEI